VFSRRPVSSSLLLTERGARYFPRPFSRYALHLQRSAKRTVRVDGAAQPGSSRQRLFEKFCGEIPGGRRLSWIGIAARTALLPR
jgi:hypothetical protein